MRLHEGKPGERLRCKDSIWHYVDIPKRPTSAGGIRVKREDGTFQRDMRFSDLARNDWEVVPGQIEVGDTVHFHMADVFKDCPCRNGGNCQVKRIDKDNRILLIRGDCFCIEHRLKGLTLIHKGSKKIDLGIMEVLGDTYMFPPEFTTIAKAGKYRVTAMRIDGN